MKHSIIFSLVCVALIAHSSWAAQGEIGLRLQIMQGEGNQNVVNQSAPVAMSVRVTDRDNRPIAGATVVFTAPDKGASGDFGGEMSFKMLTDEAGLATPKNYRPNRVEGRYPILVQAEYMGELATGIMVQTNIAGKKSHGKTIAIVAVAGAVGAALAARGAGGGSSSNSSGPATSVPSITFGTSSVSGPR